MKNTMRLDKMLGNLGYGTRSGIKALVRQGGVTVNGERAKDPGMQVDPGRDIVVLDGETVRYRDTVYVLLHKPAGVVSATEDSRDRTVLDLLDPELAVFSPFPVGRLDKDTEGLLLLTNDGKLSHDLLSPRKHVPKTYRAIVTGEVGETEAEAFRRGVELDDGYVTMPAQLRVLAVSAPEEAPSHPEMAEPVARMARGRLRDAESNAVSWIELTIHEGKFHQVKRMFESVGQQVLYLRRVSMGPLELDPSLAPGESRELTESEIDSLRQYRKEEPN
ncbi:pseudouridine synthase [Cohnella candidum]|uniref:Pseudouridine synthase n=1 Tax=Cohnella candidum TaxID=2674991 RepID=A0A3G3JY48_9BACL|nr:pseudouridine synthase [Cohnella candidum]AYQ73113.1 rRNA pseudouridine synthase [Cohnella candidum]